MTVRNERLFDPNSQGALPLSPNHIQDVKNQNRGAGRRYLMVLSLGAAICGIAILLAADKTADGDDGHPDAAAGTIVGAASMYDPSVPGYREGGVETATGEHYDPSAWAGAIRTDLRGEFGGLLHGAKRSFAVVESTDKKVIVKINDVGPLEPGRVIDFNKQTMRYFDPTLQRGLIPRVKVTPLPGDGWTPGPVDKG
jgi:rare lipoprotein A